MSQRNYSQILRRAREEKRPILLSFGGAWCPESRVFLTIQREDGEESAFLRSAAEKMGVDARRFTAALTPEGKVFYCTGSLTAPLLRALEQKWRNDPAELCAVADALEEDLFPSRRTSEGIRRLREKADSRISDRVGAVLYLLRAAALEGDRSLRLMAEEDLSRLARSGIHDHIGGGFFAGTQDQEWLVPIYEKRLSDNALLAYVYTEAWQQGHMAFYRDTAEGCLDYCLERLGREDGLFSAGQTVLSEEENPYLLTPEDLKALLGEEDGKHFGECYDVLPEGNTEGRSIPNLLLNRRWNLLPEGYEDFRETVREWRAERGGVYTDSRAPLGQNALLLAALAKAAWVYGDRRYLSAAQTLSQTLEKDCCRSLFFEDRADYCFALLELYRADRMPGHLLRAVTLAESILRGFADGEGGYCRSSEKKEPTPAGDELSRSLGLWSLTLWELARLTGDRAFRDAGEKLTADMRARPGKYALPGLPGLLPLCGGGRLLCLTSPEEGVPPLWHTLAGRYDPALSVLLKTPARAGILAAALPHTEGLSCDTSAVYTRQAEGWSKPLPLD